ncbi:hypothetical protein M3A49_35630 [Paraburkholderia sp. CNPSo 3076]|uniref:hypothetical protein n=1 Tax=Paraburkholderia sp. CNPSo 3076 TaxID=2940936 RepID=UPI0022539116|nr:hypothetical protein [Paraburkholderia sp. CNPSo 3076]MCX5544732.1 hypothetical protein [Paraburkholderia sp. CNPSo 3076]
MVDTDESLATWNRQWVWSDQAAEKRELLEIERERTTNGRPQRELEGAQQRASRDGERAQAEIPSLQTQPGDFRHQTVMLDGRFDAMRASHAAQAQELEFLRRNVSGPGSAARQVPRRAAWQSAGPCESCPQVRREVMSRTGRSRRKAACPKIGVLVRYEGRVVRVVAEARGQRAIIKSLGEDGRAFRNLHVVNTRFTRSNNWGSSQIQGGSAIKTRQTFANTCPVKGFLKFPLLLP